MQPSRQAELPAWLWLWSPVLVLFLLMVTNLAFPEFFMDWIEGEHGLVELATPVLLLPGMIFGAQAFWQGRPRINLPVRLWIGAMTLACVYFAGEELSWGQQLFGWDTPERMQQINDQQETNIHNISSWFDQKPRLLLELWVLVGGVILPIVRLVKGEEYTPDDWRCWFWPGTLCLTSALIAILAKMPERIKDLIEVHHYSLQPRWSELQELYFAVFLTLYLVSIRQRLKTTGPGHT